MRMSLLEYGARVGLVSIEPPSLSQGGGATMEVVIADGWFVGEIIDNSESSFMDSKSFSMVETVLGPGHLI